MAFEGDDLKIKIGVDSETPVREGLKAFENLKAAAKAAEKDLRVKISTSVDIKEFDKFATDIKATVKNLNDGAKINVGVKVNNAEEIPELKKKIEQLKKDTGQDFNVRFNVKQDSNAFKQIQNEIKNTSSLAKAGITVQTAVKGQIAREIAAIQSQIKGLRNLTLAGITIPIVISGVKAAIDGIRAVAQAAAGVIGVGFGKAVSLENSQVALQNTLVNSTIAVNQAKQAFASGKGTVEDYAVITKKSADSLFNVVEATGKAGSATKAYTGDVSLLRREIDRRKAQYEDSINNYEVEISKINENIRALERQREAELESIRVTDRRIKSQEAAIKTQERLLNKQVRAAEIEFDSANNEALLRFKQDEISKQQELNNLKLQAAGLSDPTALAGNKAAQDQVKNELDIIRTRQDQITNQKDAILTNIELTQNQARIELAKNKEVLDDNKAKNEEIKNNFADRIDDQKAVIDSFQDKINAIQAQIKVDLNLKAAEAKLANLQDQIASVQASAGGGGGGGGKTRVLDPRVVAEIAKLNKTTSGEGLLDPNNPDDLAKIEAQAAEQSKKIQELTKEFAKSTPFNRLNILQFAAQLQTGGFDVLAGADKSGSILQAGKDFRSGTSNTPNILAISADLIARQQGLGFSQDKATEDVLRAIDELKSGQTTSLKARFNVGNTQLTSAARSAGVLDKVGIDTETGQASASGFSKLSGEEITKVFAGLNKVLGSQGQSERLSLSATGIISNLQDSLDEILLTFFGDSNDPSSLFTEVKRSLTEFNKFLSGPDGDTLREQVKDLGKAAGKFVREVFTPENIDKFGQAIKQIVKFVTEAFTDENIESFKNGASGVGGFIKGLFGGKEEGEEEGDVKFLGLFGNRSKASRDSVEKINKGEGSFLDRLTVGLDGSGDVDQGLAFKDLGPAIGRAFSKTFTGDEDTFKFLQKDIVDAQIAEAAKSVGDFFTVTIPEKAGEGAKFIGEKWEEIKKGGQEAFQNTSNSVTEFANVTIPTKFEEGKVFATNKFEEIKTSGINKFNEIKQTVIDFTNVTIPTKFEEGKNFAVNKFNELKDGVNSKFNDMKDGVVNFATKTIPDEFGKVPKTITDKFDEAKNNVIGKDGFVEKLKSNFIDGFTNLKDSLIGPDKPLTKLFEFIKDLIEKIKEGTNKLNDLKNQASQKVTETQNGVGDFVNGLNPFRADGGPVAAGQEYIVNERGMELYAIKGKGPTKFVPPNDGFIIPADITSKILSGMQAKGGSVSNTFNNNFDIKSSGKAKLDGQYAAYTFGSTFDAFLRGNLT